MTVTVAQISDTHLSPSKPYFRDNFEIVAEELRARRPDFILNTGDLALDGADSDADLELARTAHASLGIEVHAIPGNHDVGDHPDVARRQPVNDQRVGRYRRILGHDFWALDIPGWRFIAINALTFGTGLHGDDAQQDMVRSKASSCDGRSLAIVLHKPLADERYDEPLHSSRFMTASPRATLLGLLDVVTPSVVLSGHVHQYRDVAIGGSRHVWAPATSFMISDPWQPAFGAKTVGYLEHTFDADGKHRHRLVGVRGISHHDLADFPQAYGDVRSWGPGGA